MPRAQATFAIEGAQAEEKIGKFGFFSGTHTAILNFISRNGLMRENIIGIGTDPQSLNYFIFYWK